MSNKTGLAALVLTILTGCTPINQEKTFEVQDPHARLYRGFGGNYFQVKGKVQKIGRHKFTSVGFSRLDYLTAKELIEDSDRIVITGYKKGPRKYQILTISNGDKEIDLY